MTRTWPRHGNGKPRSSCWGMGRLEAPSVPPVTMPDARRWCEPAANRRAMRGRAPLACVVGCGGSTSTHRRVAAPRARSGMQVSIEDHRAGQRHEGIGTYGGCPMIAGHQREVQSPPIGAEHRDPLDHGWRPAEPGTLVTWLIHRSADGQMAFVDAHAAGSLRSVLALAGTDATPDHSDRQDSR